LLDPDGTVSPVADPGADGAAEQARLFELSLSILAGIGADRPLVLVIEDLQWADEASRDLLVFLTRNAGRERVLTIGTYRADAVGPADPRADAPEIDAIQLLERHDRPTVPVVDDAGRLLGVITFDDAMRVARNRHTEVVQKIGGSEALDEPYLSIPVLRLVRKRGSWLVMLFLGEMLTATAMQFFNAEINRATVLALFLPLIISSGGNSGSQGSTLVIRAMALAEAAPGQWRTVLRRELVCGLLLGLLLGAVGILRISLWQWLGLFDYGSHYHLVALTVGTALVGVVTWGALMGAMLPLLLRRVHLDPAAISAPLVATLVDVTGLVIYFTTALLILRGTVL
jgi:magnesium transporter